MIQQTDKKVKIPALLQAISSVTQQEIRLHFAETKKEWPSALQALAFCATELGEAFDLLLRLENNWQRNNPEAHGLDADFDDKLARELGDVIMMAVVAGMMLDLRPLAALFRKMREAYDG